jgi:hypothetical protein
LHLHLHLHLHSFRSARPHSGAHALLSHYYRLPQHVQQRNNQLRRTLTTMLTMLTMLMMPMVSPLLSPLPNAAPQLCIGSVRAAGSSSLLQFLFICVVVIGKNTHE